MKSREEIRLLQRAKRLVILPLFSRDYSSPKNDLIHRLPLESTIEVTSQIPETLTSYYKKFLGSSSSTMPSNLTTDLRPHLALVTGASGGIGKATCLALADLGCSIAVHYYSSEDKATALLKELKEKGVRAEVFKADLTDYDQVRDFPASPSTPHRHLNVTTFPQHFDIALYRFEHSLTPIRSEFSTPQSSLHSANPRSSSTTLVSRSSPASRKLPRYPSKSSSIHGKPIAGAHF